MHSIWHQNTCLSAEIRTIRVEITLAHPIRMRPATNEQIVLGAHLLHFRCALTESATALAVLLRYPRSAQLRAAPCRALFELARRTHKAWEGSYIQNLYMHHPNTLHSGRQSLLPTQCYSKVFQ